MREIPKLKILICEADIRILSRLESWVVAIGEEAIVSSDGIASFEIYKEIKPDIVLISQELKSMGGLELLEQIKEVNPNQATILMLSDADNEMFKRAISLQVDKYLNKPVEATLLFEAVESLSQEKVWHKEFLHQKRVLQDYKEAIDLTFSVSRHDKDGKIIYVNDLFCATTGLSYSDAMSGVLNPLHNENEDMDLIWSILEKDYMYKGRQVFQLENTQERIIDITVVALADDQDSIYEYLVFLDDVTEVINTARKIKNQELDNRLTKLNHAKELNAVKDSFLTIFTHELKTPLNSIINFSEYIIKHLDKEVFAKKERLLEQTREINISGHFMLDMINNLMEAMKLRESKIEINLSEVDLQNTVHNIISTTQNSYDSIEIIQNKSAVTTIYSDEKHLMKILNNIIVNAFKYAHSKVEININVSDIEFSVTVVDDGNGFNNTENVFDMFEQSDANSMTREATGTGVGLYIVKQLCDKMAYTVELGKSDTLGGASVMVKGKREERQ